MKTYTKYEGKLTTIEWLDANQQRVNNDYLLGLQSTDSGKDLLVINTTYGKVVKVMKDVVLIVHEETTAESSGTDITIIPRGWIVTPKYLTINKNK
jgi:hypothetical protein